MLKPTSKASLDQVTVNGKKLSSMEGIVLKPNDRIIFGTNSVFLFKDGTSSAGASLPDPDEDPLTWEQAQKERSDIEDSASKQA